MVNKKMEIINQSVNEQGTLKKTFQINWLTLQDQPTIFQYKLNVKLSKRLLGKVKFYLEYNPERTVLRRIPQTIESLKPNFDENSFNFNKINPKEKLLGLKFKGKQMTLIVNQSPLTIYHALICPQIKDNLPQIITIEAIEFSIYLLKIFNDISYRIGYNSPGALASVNHLHLHTIYLKENLPVEELSLIRISKNLYKFDSKYGYQAFCFELENFKSETEQIEFSNRAYRAICVLLDKGVPHNLLFSLNCGKSKCPKLRMFLYVREKMCKKDLGSLNLGFCELSGYFPLGDLERYETLTEGIILDRISKEVGNAFDRVLIEFQNQFIDE